MIIALNNKCNLTKEEFINYEKELNNINTTDRLILCPSPLNIALATSSNYSLGSQNVSKNDNGAHTGEVSAKQLKSFNVKYTIVGHSERRQELLETNEDINKKLKLLLEEDIIPILCIGETKEEREQNLVEKVLLTELNEALSNISEENKQKIIIAYEPIWSIGTGLIPSNDQIEEVFNLIKTLLPTNKILYGGSANENNIDELKKCSVIDGYLLGGLSLKPKNLQNFINKNKI